MAEKLGIYKCNVCGNIVLVMHSGKGELVCCKKPMELLIAGSVDAAVEKHVPVIEKKENEYKVKVGSTPHPMTEEHYIEWIELHADNDKVYIKFLKPGDNPEATFQVKAQKVLAKEYCNLHGLWESSK
ncbi:MAG: desulfoferrodoxin [Thermodesulfobacterium sp.]|nr:desulfoferrodoxin [Thermodesulfobacterium sp.]